VLRGDVRAANPVSSSTRNRRAYSSARTARHRTPPLSETGSGPHRRSPEAPFLSETGSGPHRTSPDASFVGDWLGTAPQVPGSPRALDPPGLAALLALPSVGLRCLRRPGGFESAAPSEVPPCGLSSRWSSWDPRPSVVTRSRPRHTRTTPGVDAGWWVGPGAPRPADPRLADVRVQRRSSLDPSSSRAVSPTSTLGPEAGSSGWTRKGAALSGKHGDGHASERSERV
jgi:hypothetical protein